MKKALKIIGIILGVFILLLLATPFLFKGGLEKMLKNTINENLDATVSWESMDLSLFRSFPQASVQLKNFSVINHEPFKGDTLISGKGLNLEMGIMQLFKSKDILIDAVKLEGSNVNIRVDSQSRANYDISIKDNALRLDEETSSEGFNFDLKDNESRKRVIINLDKLKRV